MERSGLTFEHFCLEMVKNCSAKKKFFFADFALQNMVETTLPDGLETSSLEGGDYSELFLGQVVLDAFCHTKNKINFQNFQN